MRPHPYQWRNASSTICQNMPSTHLPMDLKEDAIKALRNLLIKTTSINELNLDIAAKDELASKRKLPTPEIVNMPLLKRHERFRQKEHVIPSTYTAIIDGLIYCPWHNIFLTPSRQVLLDSVGTKRYKSRFSLKHIYATKTKNISGISSIFRSSTESHSRNYSHTLIDNVCRLWALVSSSLVKDKEVNLLFSSEPTEIESFFLKELLPENFIITVLSPSNLYRCEKILFSPAIVNPPRAIIPIEYSDFLLSKLGPKRESRHSERIYISRENSNSRSVQNEQQLCDFLKTKGFKKYHLETMSMQDKVELFYDADCVIGAYGAGLANTIFSQNTRIVEMFPGEKSNPYYYFLSKSLGNQHVTYHGQSADERQNFKVDLTQISEVINKLN